jgi:hypothetical protein
MSRVVGMAVVLGLLGAGLWLIFGPGYFARSTAPYLQKFDGRWRVVFAPTEQSARDGLGCQSVQATARAHAGTLSNRGLLLPALGIEASITAEGNLSGTFSQNKAHAGPLEGRLAGSAGAGSYSDDLGCRGNIVFTKLDPVADPVMGRVISTRGARLVRAGASKELLPGESLYAGDIVDATEGQALLSMGADGRPVTVMNNTYPVLAPQ